MTKHDWTVLLIRILGLYFLATYLATFITSTATLGIAIYSSPKQPLNLTLVQGAFASAIILILASALISKAHKIAIFLFRFDKK
ncbi:hypothetical protein TSACC_2172 [Terrimicrobium sacchariphilum]|jgi:hypothetical protein|uniref:Uncharacterized protein n=1 Tax=Terrimicrobium sacchariphilum TaxID=690879 RepID=A0A146G4M2_TERSA|nr:hypothetical protein [Terrimicrobium sacchariphilum]GAT31778.1 hypothetical protein TSACC_2172 [Terrimicrobium sacchariphilum]